MATPSESETSEVTNNADDMKQQENQHPLNDKSEQEGPTSENDSAAEDLKNEDANSQKFKSTKPSNHETFSTELGYYKKLEVSANAEDMNMKQQENELMMSELEQEAPTSDEISAEKDMENEAKKCQETKTKGPIKYEKIANEIRLHILSFTDLKTLRQYRQCSKKCNEEFLKFQLPFRIELLDVDGVIEMNLAYKNPDKVKSKKFEKIEKLQSYFTKMYRYFAEDLNEVVINMKQWPAEIVKMQPFASTTDWNVTIQKSMYDDFIEFAKTKVVANRIYCNHLWSLHLNECDTIEDRVIVGPEFFKSGILRNLRNLDISTKSQMDCDDLLNCRNVVHLRVKNWMDLEALRQRVELETFNNNMNITIDLSPEDDLTFKMAELFPRDRFLVRYIEKYCKFRIGACLQGKIMRNGKYLRLKGHRGDRKIYKSDSEETDEDAYGEEDERTDDGEYPEYYECWGVTYESVYGDTPVFEESVKNETSDVEEKVDNSGGEEAKHYDCEESDDGNDGDDEDDEHYGN